MSLRPEELVRKAIAAGYGDPSPSNPQAVHDDPTCVLVKMGVDVETGDWVTVVSSIDGHLTIHTPAANESAKWLGVVQHKARNGEWARVKTAGACWAKVDSGATIGDLLEVYSGSKSARKITGTFSCGRFLKKFAGDDRLAWVMIEGSPGVQLLVHHHDDAQNTQVKDLSAGGLTGSLFNVWKVVDLQFTGSPTLNNLATCLGGGTVHGEGTYEGLGWAGVIGNPSKMGAGEIGGNEKSGLLGVLGAEIETPTSDSAPYPGRINIRSWAGVNAHDRYGISSPTVAPIRYSWCQGGGGNGGGGKDPTWHVPSGCDCLLGVTTSDLCDPTIEWWSGTMKLDPVVKPRPFTRTPWEKQWTPQLALERDCVESEPASHDVEIVGAGCSPFENPKALEANALAVSGAYEDLIPWGYTPQSGRMDVLHGVACHATHLQTIYRILDRLQDFLSGVFTCMDANFVSLSRSPCCSEEGKKTIPAVGCGPHGSKCDPNFVAAPPPGETTPTEPNKPPPTTTPPTTGGGGGGGGGGGVPSSGPGTGGQGYPGFDPISGRPIPGYHHP